MTQYESPPASAHQPHGTPAALPARFRLPRAGSLLIGILLLGLAVSGLVRMDVSWARLGQGPSNIWDFFTGAFPPNLQRAPNLAEAMFETLEMAMIGTILGVLLSVPVAVLAAQNTTPFAPLGVALRMLLSVLRSIPELVWALVFVMAVGLGPLAGILAIMVDVLGFAGRFFAERIEEVERGPIDALRSTGAGGIAVVASAILPSAFASFAGTSLFCLEKAIRGATILGMVGAGGIGMELTPAFTLRQFDTALTIILIILVVVFLAEQLSSLVRRKMLGAGQLQRAV